MSREAGLARDFWSGGASRAGGGRAAGRLPNTWDSASLLSAEDKLAISYIRGADQAHYYHSVQHHRGCSTFLVQFQPNRHGDNDDPTIQPVIRENGIDIASDVTFITTTVGMS
jgi:hypothetical protein